MAKSFNLSSFWQGYLACAPFILVVAPFGLLFGVVATEAGFNLTETMTMTVLVIAGAAQFTAIALLQEQAPTIVIILASLAVNLRMAMYSLALVPHIGKAARGTRLLAAYFLVDQVYAVSANRFDHGQSMTIQEKTSYLFGTAAAVAPFWYGFTLLGALVGESIPAHYSVDFALPVCFISMFAPLMRSLPHLAAVLVSIVLSLLFYWMPYNLGLLVAALLAMSAAVQVERWLAGRRVSS